MRCHGIVVCLIVGTMWSSELRGQRNDDPESRGWGNVAIGWGHMHCEECDASASGMSLGLAWGLAANDRFLFALSLDAIVGGRYNRAGTACLFPVGCGESRSEGRDMVFALTPIVRFYPLVESGLFVRAGMGVGFSGMGNPNTLFDFGPESGLGTTLGVGWDVHLSESNVAVTPVVNGVWIRASDQTSRSVQVGVGLTFH